MSTETPPTQTSTQPVSEDQAKLEKMYRLRGKLVEELSTTEKTYVISLRTATSVFLKPIRKDNKMSVEDQTIIFNNIEAVLDISTEFWKETAARLKFPEFQEKPQQACIADIALKFLSSEQFSATYQKYINGFDKAMSLVESLMSAGTAKKPTPFISFIRECEEDPVCRNLSLGSFLVTPVQRIPRYVLLLRDILARTPENHPDYFDTKKALELAQQMATAINERKRESENLMKLEELESLFLETVPGKKPIQLIEPGRKFICQGPINVMLNNLGQPGEMKRRQVLLFNDLMVCVTLTVVKKTKKNPATFTIKGNPNLHYLLEWRYNLKNVKLTRSKAGEFILSAPEHEGFVNSNMIKYLLQPVGLAKENDHASLNLNEEEIDYSFDFWKKAFSETISPLQESSLSSKLLPLQNSTISSVSSEPSRVGPKSTSAPSSEAPAGSTRSTSSGEVTTSSSGAPSLSKSRSSTFSLLKKPGSSIAGSTSSTNSLVPPSTKEKKRNTTLTGAEVAQAQQPGASRLSWRNLKAYGTFGKGVSKTLAKTPSERKLTEPPLPEKIAGDVSPPIMEETAQDKYKQMYQFLKNFVQNTESKPIKTFTSIKDRYLSRLLQEGAITEAEREKLLFKMDPIISIYQTLTTSFETKDESLLLDICSILSQYIQAWKDYLDAEPAMYSLHLELKTRPKYKDLTKEIEIKCGEKLKELYVRTESQHLHLSAFLSKFKKLGPVEEDDEVISFVSGMINDIMTFSTKIVEIQRDKRNEEQEQKLEKELEKQRSIFDLKRKEREEEERKKKEMWEEQRKLEESMRPEVIDVKTVVLGQLKFQSICVTDEENEKLMREKYGEEKIEEESSDEEEEEVADEEEEEEEDE